MNERRKTGANSRLLQYELTCLNQAQCFYSAKGVSLVES
jgi:hypothetical protein